MSNYTAGKIELPNDDAILARLDKIEVMLQEILTAQGVLMLNRGVQEREVIPIDKDKVMRPKVEIMEAEFVGEVSRVTDRHAGRWVSALSGEVFHKGQYFVVLYNKEWSVNNLGYPRSFSTYTYANAYILLDEAIAINHPHVSAMLAAKKEKYERQ